MYLYIKPVQKENNIRKKYEVTEGYSNCEGRRICEKLEGMNNMKILVL
jgi:hypothetical protein